MFPSCIPQYEELIEEMAKRAPTPEMGRRLLSLRDVGFQFDKVQDNLPKAAANMQSTPDIINTTLQLNPDIIALAGIDAPAPLALA